jgi:hypothetical protein
MAKYVNKANGMLKHKLKQMLQVVNKVTPLRTIACE